MFKIHTAFILLAILILGCDSNLTTVTYPGIGTFSLTDFYHPIYRPIVLLPNSPEDMNATFCLYTPNNVDDFDELDWNNTDHYESTRFDANLDTKIIIHGWRGDSQEAWLSKLKDTLLKAKDLNVIIVGWPGGAKTPYTQAVSNTRVIGIMMGILIENLMKEFNVSLNSFHLIGHSLGGHIVGYAGKHLNGSIARITGLDPAGPFYKGLNETEARLWHTDAKFVEVIHTDAQPIIQLGLGMFETCGHVDIYPNGGQEQPGCEEQAEDEVPIEGGIYEKYKFSSCNHGRSHDLFIDSVSPTISKPVSYLCESYESFQNGECKSRCDGSECVIINPLVHSYPVNKSYTQGKRFFMATAAEENYFRYQYRIDLKMIKNDISIKPLLTQVELRFINQDGVDEQFFFSKKSEVFEDETEYPRLFVLNIDPEQLSKIEIKWTLGLNIIPTKMNIEYIKVTALSFQSNSTNVQPITMMFIPNIDGGIPNDEWISCERNQINQ
ncbi:pancreatic triacylglycerol lipase-like [Dermatophagoides pteronyssinus]|uniref:pancreatic triacylglycerol lipase-like n=1 Tax=Dermatophagoides pteronyssinus TaxID=6956 RepID=UPI003F66AD17